jgi:hypothetical protein
MIKTRKSVDHKPAGMMVMSGVEYMGPGELLAPGGCSCCMCCTTTSCCAAVVGHEAAGEQA